MSQIRGSATVLATIFAASLVVAKVWSPPAPEPFIPLTENQLPRSVAGYEVEENAQSTVNGDVRSTLSSATVATHSYRPAKPASNYTEAPIEFILIGGTDRSALHDPRSCLIGSGWTIENDFSESLKIDGKTIPAHSCRITNATLPGKPSFDIIYLYVVDGKVIESVSQIRAQMLVSALLGKKNTPVYFLRFMREVAADTTESNQSHEEMRSFAGNMWGALDLISYEMPR